MLLPCALLDTLLFLCALGLFIAPLLLSVLLLLVLALPQLLLSMLLFRLGLLVLALLLFGMVLLFAVLLLLCVGRSSDSEKQRQNGCAGDSNYFHRCYLRYCWIRTLALAQASCRRVDRVADGFAGYEKFDSPVPLPAGRVVV